MPIEITTYFNRNNLMFSSRKAGAISDELTTIVSRLGNEASDYVKTEVAQDLIAVIEDSNLDSKSTLELLDKFYHFDFFKSNSALQAHHMHAKPESNAQEIIRRYRGNFGVGPIVEPSVQFYLGNH